MEKQKFTIYKHAGYYEHTSYRYIRDDDESYWYFLSDLVEALGWNSALAKLAGDKLLNVRLDGDTATGARKVIQFDRLELIIEQSGTKKACSVINVMRETIKKERSGEQDLKRSFRYLTFLPITDLVKFVDSIACDQADFIDAVKCSWEKILPQDRLTSIVKDASFRAEIERAADRGVLSCSDEDALRFVGEIWPQIKGYPEASDSRALKHILQHAFDFKNVDDKTAIDLLTFVQCNTSIPTEETL